MTVAVSSWALHGAIKASRWDSPRGPVEIEVNESGSLDLLDLPGALKVHGFDRLELCHFHLLSREPGYLADVRTALKESGVTLQTLLIDDGDISDHATGDRDRDWIAGWVETAEELGSEGARVIAGKQAWSPETADRSAKHLASVAGIGPRIRIENWFDLLKTPADVFTLLDRLEGRVGLCMDYGNWGGPTKYEDLAAIAPRAETCHAKCEFLGAATLDSEDYGRCVELSVAAGFQGPFVLVTGGAGGDVWEALKLQTQFLASRTGPLPLGERVG